MGKQRKKSGKELRKEAQNIQIVVTCDNEEEDVKVIRKTSSKNLAFEDQIESFEDDQIQSCSEVNFWCWANKGPKWV